MYLSNVMVPDGLSAARLITDFEQQIGPQQEPQHH